MHYIHILSCTKLRFLPLPLMYINCNYFCTKLYLMTYFYLKSKALKKYKGVTYIALVLVNTSFFIFWKGEFTVNGDVSWKYLTLVVFTHELNSLSLQYKHFFAEQKEYSVLRNSCFTYTVLNLGKHIAYAILNQNRPTYFD